MMLKAVILIGGPEKGTRFRPLSLDIPKPLFPIGGVPLIQHHIEACCAVSDLKEILLIGYFQPTEHLNSFVQAQSQEHGVIIRYLQEFAALGTAGSIYHFRDQILFGQPDAIFLLNGDVCADYCLEDMLEFHRSRDHPMMTIMGTEAIASQSLEFGCIVENKETKEIKHYVDKPSSYVSSLISCGIYIVSSRIFPFLASVLEDKKTQSDSYGVDLRHSTDPVTRRGSGFLNGIGAPSEAISLEKDVIPWLATLGGAFVYRTNGWWSQINTAGAAIYANRHCLKLYHKTHPERLATGNQDGPKIIGDVFIHPTARVDSSAVIGPNVSIHQNVVVGPGARIRDAIVLNDVTLADNCCILNSIIGWGSSVGSWSRIEGTPNDPNPDKPFAKLEHVPLFSSKGYLNPSITILGSKVNVPAELMILNSIVLPKKDLAHSYKNQIIL